MFRQTKSFLLAVHNSTKFSTTHEKNKQINSLAAIHPPGIFKLWPGKQHEYKDSFFGRYDQYA